MILCSVSGKELGFRPRADGVFRPQRGALECHADARGRCSPSFPLTGIGVFISLAECQLSFLGLQGGGLS